MEVSNRKRSSSLPAKYVTLLDLKERWLKEKERQQEEEARKIEDERRKIEQERQRKEEAELRQQKIRQDEQAKQRNQNAVVSGRDTDFRPRNRGRRMPFRPDDRSVSEPEGAELEGNILQKQNVLVVPGDRSNRAHFRAGNRGVSESEGAELEGKKQQQQNVVVRTIETNSKLGGRRNGVQYPQVNRSVSECEGAELEGKNQEKQDAVVLKTGTDFRNRKGSNRAPCRPENRTELEGKNQEKQYAVVLKTETDFKPRTNKTQFRQVNRSVSECDGAELEGKNQEKQDAVVLKTRTDFRTRRGSNRAQFRPENRTELDQEKQYAVVLKTETDFKPRSNQTRFRQVNRSVSECEGAELEGKNQEKQNAVVLKTETGFKPMSNQGQFRPDNQIVSVCEGAELEEKEREGPEEKKKPKKRKWGKKSKKKVRAAEKEEVTEKEAPPQGSSDQVTGSEERMLEIEIRAKSDNVAPEAEIVPKFRGLSVDGENGKGGDKWRRPSRVDNRGNGEMRDYKRSGRLDVQKQRDFGRVWVKKGKVAAGNGGGVRTGGVKRNEAISGQTGTSLNGSSLIVAGEMSRRNTKRWWQNKGKLNCSVNG